MLQPNWSIFSAEDMKTVENYIGPFHSHGPRDPDLVIAPDGQPYLYRWHVVRTSGEGGNVYFHIQVADDPERPLHDHPWDNMSVILAGGYLEMLQQAPPHGYTAALLRRKGQVIFRRATEAHRLLIPEGVRYTMSQFTTGPKARQWGFWYPSGWAPFDQVTEMLADGRSVHRLGTDYGSNL